MAGPSLLLNSIQLKTFSIRRWEDTFQPLNDSLVIGGPLCAEPSSSAFVPSATQDALIPVGTQSYSYDDA